MCFKPISNPIRLFLSTIFASLAFKFNLLINIGGGAIKELDS